MRKILRFCLESKWDRLNEAEEYLIRWGGMPALTGIKDEGRKIAWLRDYLITYLERDLADLSRMNDLMPFRKFQQLAALRASNLIAYSELARDAGIGTETARRYLEYLRDFLSGCFVTAIQQESDKQYN